MRVAIGGFQHETNTFSPFKTGRQEFIQKDGWPEFCFGDNLIEKFNTQNIPITGFINQANKLSYELAPLAWANAVPGGLVTDDAFSLVVDKLCDELKACGEIDAVYLDLHGAMVTESYQDGEGEILSRVRTIVGKDIPIIASLDFHANVTRKMVDTANLLLGYRTYPHVDMAAIGAECADQIQSVIEQPYAKAWYKFPFMMSLVSQCTLESPMRELFAKAEQLERNHNAKICFTPGFAPADIEEAGPALICYAETEQAAQAILEDLQQSILTAKKQFIPRFWAPEEAIDHAMANPATKPYIFADSQDNPGAGGSSDSVGIIRALIAKGAKGAAVGVIHDPEAASLAFAAGKGCKLSLELGAKVVPGQEQPIAVEFKVCAINDEIFLGTGPFFKDCEIDLGETVLLETAGVYIIVSSKRFQAADQAIFRQLGLEPSELPIISLKSSVHFRADFNPIAQEVLVVDSPGLNPTDIKTLEYKNLRPDVELL